MIRRDVFDAFPETGLLSDGSLKAAAAKVSDDGRYVVTSIDAALSKCTALKGHERIEIKNVLGRHSLLISAGGFNPLTQRSRGLPFR
jgi:hypothetical protein